MRPSGKGTHGRGRGIQKEKRFLLHPDKGACQPAKRDTGRVPQSIQAVACPCAEGHDPRRSLRPPWGHWALEELSAAALGKAEKGGREKQGWLLPRD